MSGLVHLYEGDGKGKTSAGVGMAIRCAGRGQQVLYTQFLKDNSSGELSVLNRLELIHVMPCEQSFGFTFRMNEEIKAAAADFYSRHLQKVIDEAVTGTYRLLVLDEIIACYNLKMIDGEMLLTFLKNKPKQLEIVMTGREPAQELVELSDYVSRIVKIKHPFDRGISARAGIEY